MTSADRFDAQSLVRTRGLDHVPHADHWLGAWAIEPTAFRSLVARIERLNLNLHLQSAADRFSERRGTVVTGFEGDMPIGYEITPDGIAVISLEGSLTKHASSIAVSGSTVLTRGFVRHAATNEKVCAIALRLDSPGGTVAGTKDLAQDVARAAERKPVWAYAEDLCASACYWIGSAADRLWANDTALVGSIGTLMVVYDVSRQAEQDGVKVHVLSTGELKGAGAPGAPITDAQLAYWQRTVDALNGHFLEAVGTHRRLDAAQVRDAATGEVWIAAQAKRRGLIDEIGTFDAFLDRLASARIRSDRRPPQSASAEDPTPAPDAAAPASPSEPNAPPAPPAADVSSPSAAATDDSAAFSHPETESDMSAPTTAAAPAQTPAAPAPATYAEIVAACRGCDPTGNADDSRFVCDQLRSSATVPQATSAWMDTLKARADIRANEAAEERKRADESAKQAARPNPGNPAVPASTAAPSASDTDDPVSEWNEAVAAELKPGVPREKAVLAADRRHPGLRQRMLAAVN